MSLPSPPFTPSVSPLSSQGGHPIFGFEVSKREAVGFVHSYLEVHQGVHHDLSIVRMQQILDTIYALS